MSQTKKAKQHQGNAERLLPRISVVGGSAPLVPGGELLPKQKRALLPNDPKRALAEAARVYRECRRNQLDVETGARLVYMAKSCADMHKDHVLKAEVESLKQSVERIVAALQAKGALL